MEIETKIGKVDSTYDSTLNRDNQDMHEDADIKEKDITEQIVDGKGIHDRNSYVDATSSIPVTKTSNIQSISCVRNLDQNSSKNQKKIQVESTNFDSDEQISLHSYLQQNKSHCCKVKRISEAIDKHSDDHVCLKKQNRRLCDFSALNESRTHKIRDAIAAHCCKIYARMAWGSAATSGWFTYYRLWLIEASTASYFEELAQRIKTMRYEEVLRDVRQQFAIPTVTPYHINDSIIHCQHPQQSPGLPYTSKGFTRKDQVNPNVIKQYIRNLKYGVFRKCTTPCRVYARTCEAMLPKFRLFFEYPAHMTFAEAMFTQPLINGYLSVKGPYGCWINCSHDHIRYVMSHRKENDQWLNLDWTGFEQRIPAWLIRDAFNILKQNLDFTSYSGWGGPANPELLPKLWRDIIQYFIDTPIKFSSGKVKPKRSGVPIGSYFTNMIDTIVNAIVTQYLLRKLEIPYSCSEQWYVGENALVLVQKTVDLSQFAELALHEFRFILNTDKSECGTDVNFLGYAMTPSEGPKSNVDTVEPLISNPDETKSRLGQTERIS